MSEGKYVMSAAGAVLFPDTFNHSDFRFLNPTSAGRFSMFVDDAENCSVQLYGDSLTLDLKPAGDDAAKIKCCFDATVSLDGRDGPGHRGDESCFDLSSLGGRRRAA